MPCARRSLFALLLILGIAALTILPTALLAQGISVAVVNRVDKRPLGPASVALLDDRGGIAVQARATDSLGRLTLQAPAPGTYRVLTRRLGFRADTSLKFRLETGKTIVRRIELERVAQQLAVVDVKAFAAFEQRAFASRQRTNNGGRLFTASDLDSLHIEHVADAVNMTPGASITPLPNYPYYRYDGRDATMARAGLNNRAGCTRSFYWNGMRMADEGAIGFLLELDPKTIMGIEVYPSGISIPGEFSFGAPCAVIAVWTKKKGQP